MRISDWSSDVCSSDLRASTLELGFRRGVPGVDPVALTGNLAYTRWRDIQADVTDRIGIPTTANTGDGRIYTVEGRVAIRPAPRPTLDRSIIYNDNRPRRPAQFLRSAEPRVGTECVRTCRFRWAQTHESKKQ